MVTFFGYKWFCKGISAHGVFDYVNSCLSGLLWNARLYDLECYNDMVVNLT